MPLPFKEPVSVVGLRAKAAAETVANADNESTRSSLAKRRPLRSMKSTLAGLRESMLSVLNFQF